jgi:hypothetical protein
MDVGAVTFSESWPMDVLLWTVGSVILNRVVLTQLRAASGLARRLFFGIVALCLVVLFATLSAAAPLLGVDPTELAGCDLDMMMFALLVATPALLFVVHAAFFQRFFPTGGRALVLLVSSSLALVGVTVIVRKTVVLPKLCIIHRVPNRFMKSNDTY